MPFPYYSRLSRSQKAIYRKSAAAAPIRIPRAEDLWPLVDVLEQALAHGQPSRLRRAAQTLCRRLCEALGVEPVAVQVLARRPASAGEELHGLYTPRDEEPARITVWMRTARHKKVVAFRTFLRTLLHELCHHLDYTLLDLADSFHTEGFFRRESGIFSQLVPQPTAKKPPASGSGAKPDGAAKKRAVQLPLFLR